MISKETIQLIFTAKDQTKTAFSSMQTGLDRIRKVAERANKAFTALGGRAVLRGLRSVAGGLTSIAGIGGLIGGGGLVASFALLAKQGLETGDSIAKTADKLDIATEGLSRLRFAVSQTSDVAEGQFDKALENMTRRLSEASDGIGTARVALEALGLDANNLKELGPEAAFKAISDTINDLPTQADKARAAFEIFGRQGVGLLNTLRLGSEGLADLGDRADALGISFSRIDVGRIEAANDALGRVRSILTGLGTAIAVEVAAPLQAAAQSVEDWVVQQGGVQQIVQDMITVLVNGLNRIGQFASGVFSFFDGIADRIDAVTVGALKAQKSLNIVGIGLTKAARARNLENELALEKQIEEVQKRRADRESGSGIETDFAGLGTSFFDALQNPEPIKIEFDVPEVPTLAAVRSAATPSTPTTASRLPDPEEERRKAEDSIQALRESLDERLKIESDYQRSVADLRSNAIDAGQNSAQIISLEEALNQRRTDQLIALDTRQREIEEAAAEDRVARQRAANEQIAADAEQIGKAINLGSLIDFDTTQDITSGLRALNEAFNSELVEINLAPLSLDEKSGLVSEARQLKEALEGELQVTARISSAVSISEGAGEILSGVGAITGASASSAATQAQERAEQIKQVQADLNSAIEAGNEAEVASNQSKLAALEALQKKEDALAKRRFEQNKKVQIASAIASTITAGLKAFQSAPWPTNFPAMFAALAAGYAQVKTLASTSYNSTAAVGGSSGSAGATGSGGGASSSQIQNANQPTAQQQPVRNGTLRVEVPETAGRIWTEEMLLEMVRNVEARRQSGDYDDIEWLQTGT